MRGTSTLRNMGMSSTLYGPAGDPPPSPTEAYRATFDMFIDPTAGTSFADSSGNTQPAWATSWTEGGDPTWAATGWVLDGTNDGWTSSGNPGADLDGGTIFIAFTVSIADSTEGILSVREATSSSSQGWDIRKSSANAVQTIAGDGSSQTAANSAGYVAGTMTSIAVTFDQAGEDEFTVHQDGEVLETRDLAGLGDIFLATEPLEVGAVNSIIDLNGVIHGLVWESSGLDTSAIAGLHTYFAGVASA